MTTLDKMQISGIRSYDPKSPVLIKFSKPLTLIIGKNGSGKTTIVEALRFVCTGQNPPDSLKGKSFIHDPLIYGECIVKAQIKLSLNTFEGRPVTIIRSFQLSQTAKSRKYQQIDATIRSINDRNEKITATHKCAEIDGLAAQIMKVSKAILSNVIFCHQEDSLWPLSDSKTLKLKFDDIFASTRYTKALEKLKKLRKNCRVKTNFLEKDLVFVKSNLQSYSRYKKDLEELKKQVLNLEKTVVSLRKDIGNSDSKLKVLQEKTEKLRGKEAQLDKSVFLVDGIEEKKTRIDKELTEISDLDEKELRRESAVCRNLISKMENDKENMKQKIKNLSKRIFELKSDYEQNIKNIGKVQVDEERNQIYLKKIEVLTESLAQKHDFMVKAGSVIQQADVVVSKIEKSLMEEQKKLSILSDRFSLMENETRKKLQKERDGLSTLTQISKQQINEYKMSEEKLIKLSSSSLSIERELKSKKATKDKIDAIKKQLNNYGKDRQKPMTDEIEKMQKKMKTKKEDLRAVDMELDIMGIESKTEEKIKLIAEGLKTKENEFKSALENSKTLLENVSNKEISDKTFCGHSTENKTVNFGETYQKFVEKTIFENKNKKSTLNKNLRNGKVKMGQVTGKIDIFNAEISNLSNSLQEEEKRVPCEIKNKNVDDILKETEERLEKIQKEINFEKSAYLTYQKLIEDIKEMKKCPICNKRLFKKDAINVIENLNEKISLFEEKSRSEKSIIKTEEAYKKKIVELKKIFPVQERITSLNKNLGTKKIKLSEFVEEMNNIEEKLKNYENVEKDLIRKEESLSRALADSKCLGNLFVALEKLKSDLKQEKYNLKSMFGNQKSGSKLRLEKKKLQMEVEEDEKKLDEKRKDLETFMSRKQEIIMKLSELKDKDGKLNSLEKETEKNIIEKEKLKKKISKLGESQEDTKTSIKSSKKIANEVEESLKSLIMNFNIDKKRAEENIKGLIEEKNKFLEPLGSVKNFEITKKERAEIMDMFNSVKNEKADLESERENYLKIMEMSDNELETQKTKLMNYTGSIELKEIENELISKTKKITKLKSEINTIRKEDGLVERLSKRKENHEELKKMLFEAEGRKGAFKQQILSTSKSIKNNNSFDGIEEKFEKTLVELESNLIANKDIEIFQKALDNALIEYHSITMKEINQILKKYWKLIYKSNDIDYIEIVSSASEPSVSKPSNRSYNYFVVMVSGEVRLEMRGRCSSGQKVMASLLIRLALAESFCGNCNVLALDEPTTNLDEQNALSFGESLNELINAKRESSDFQLILITHNEKFAELLGSKDILDEYIRVYKDERNHSKVSKVSCNKFEQ